MKTASFYTYKGPGRICIARYAPRNVPAGYGYYRTLAPGEWFRMTDEAEYRRRYFAMLAQLSPQKTWDELHALAGDAEPVLLCYERPPFTSVNWCHRRMVAEWFAEHLGVEVPEYGAAEKTESPAQLALPELRRGAERIRASISEIRVAVKGE